MASKEYLEELWRNAKKVLPGWQYAMLRRMAQPVAGGRASHRVVEPTFLEKIALEDITPERIRAMSDGDLGMVWVQLSEWYHNAKRRRQAVENFVNAALWVKRELTARDKTLSDGPLLEAVAELEQTKDKKVEKKYSVQVPIVGKAGAKVAFVGASPSRIDAARREPFVGPDGEVFVEKYLKPLDLERNDAVLLNIVPQLLLDENGNQRTPTREELITWREWVLKNLDELKPKSIVALGRISKAVIGDRADVVVPHPSVVRRYGDSGEVGRKLKQVRQLVEERIAKASIETEETNEDVATRKWESDWWQMLPESGQGEFVYQHHWRGLSEDEIKASDKELMNTEHSVHGDLRLSAGDHLWGFTVFLGDTKGNRGPNFDRLIDAKVGVGLQGVPKLSQPTAWKDVGVDKPYISPPGSVGATANKFAKLFARDVGKYQMGVARQHAVEIFLDGEHLNGRYLITYAPVAGGERRWLITKPEDQTPTAERTDLADVLGELKRKGQRYLYWSKPGDAPRLIDTKTGRDVERKQDASAKILKADQTKRIVYGVVLDPYGNLGKPDFDAHGDWPSPSAVENTAHNFMRGPKTIKLQHREQANAQLLESWVEPYPTRKDYLSALAGQDHAIYRRPFGSDYLHSGSWCIAVELGPDEWEEYEDGKINAFSPGGMGTRTPLKAWQLPKVEIKELKP